MIVDFGCPATKELFTTGRASVFGDAGHAALRKLDLIHCATSPKDIRSCRPAAQRSNARKCSIPVDKGWQLHFSWEGRGVRGVRLACGGEAGASALPAEDQQRIVTHPGEVLREEFMLPLGLSSNKIALAISVPVSRMLDIVNERRGISSDTASRLARFFGNSARFWTFLQAEYELSVIRMEKQPLLGAIAPWEGA
ncbi:MAG: HigA family addiction module antitoxin [Desulfovibrio sp.]|nr:HigA family addiction module antidote protein [Mailhella sp.]